MVPSRAMASGFVQGVTGADLPRQQPTVAAPQVERVVVSLVQPGNTVPSKYYKLNNKWTNELGQQIRGMKQVNYLNSLIPTHGRKETIDLSKITMPPPGRAKARRTTK